jgi:hypothetical protein
VSMSQLNSSRVVLFSMRREARGAMRKLKIHKVEAVRFLKILVAAFLQLSVLLPADSLWAVGEIGDLAIRPAPPAPPLPPAGGKFNDPTYGTTILRVTDRTDGSQAHHPYSFWSPFNAKSTRFVISLDGTWTLYDFNPTAFTSKKVGPACCPPGGTALDFETARWHPTNPDVLYALEPSTQRRQLFAYNVATQVYTLVHDFTNVAPIGGYPSSLSMSQDGRYFAFYSSTTGGQDSGDFVVAYDLQTNTVYSLDFKAQTGLSNIHAAFLDKSGTYVKIQAGSQTPNQPETWVWNFQARTFDTLLWNLADSPGGHWVLGSGNGINPYFSGGQHIVRQLSAPHTYVPVIIWPQRDGKINWQSDSHLSWNHTQTGFVYYSEYTASSVSGWVLQSGAIYKRGSFAATSLTLRAPEGVYHNGVKLIQSASMPTGSGQWYYDAPNDTLYVWLVNNADATDPANTVVPFAWWPIMEEIVQVWIDDPTNLTKIRRLAHHQSHWPNTGGGYGDMPRASSDPSGQFVLFDSNWGGSGHVDVFILNVSSSMPTPSPAPPAPPTSPPPAPPAPPTSPPPTTSPTPSTPPTGGGLGGFMQRLLDMFRK